MKVILTSDKVSIPAQVTLALHHKEVTVTGLRGTETCDFKSTQLELELQDGGSTLEVRCWLADRKTRAMVGTVCGHIRNMVKRVLVGYQITMIPVYSRHPIYQKVDSTGTLLTIRNFMGGRKVSKIQLQGNAKCTFKGTMRTIWKNSRNIPFFHVDQTILRGTNLEDVTQNAALIEAARKGGVKDKDPAKFGVGIYRKKLEFIDPDALI